MKETYWIENIKCGGCANSIRNAAMQVEGIVAAEVDIENQSVELDSDRPEAIPAVLEKLNRLGYPAAGQNNVLKKARSYVSCALGRLDEAQND
jgi:copper chaperone CopZ